ncbi:uncharacterized protein LOC109716064 isoform X4 [Ananas comosus]|uniref:Uncharacterized protein LOC109716064 isoform X4 n=1 Tax=Ananas comosus TaxID=4615 RepID=A0A6P5FV22_ANACO|nr:uncharacterized protein LOC109716064 isoform X4 [Ananas comosus]
MMAWSIARAASLMKLRLRLSSSPIPPHLNPSTTLFLSGNPISGRSSELKVLRNYVSLASPVYAQRFRSVFSMQKMIGRSLHLSGRKLFTGTFIGISILGGLLHRPSNIAYAMDVDDYAEPSGYLKDDLNTFWALTRKFQLPVVLLVMVFLGWRRPVTLVVNIILLLFCTRPSPFSIYMFIEQLRQREMRRDPSFHKTKFLYARNVEVEDYKLLCIGEVELRDKKLHVIGILGGWWIFSVSHLA